MLADRQSYFSLHLPQKNRFPENGSLLLIGQFEENIELEKAAVSGEDRCVTTLITAAKETNNLQDAINWHSRLPFGRLCWSRDVTFGLWSTCVQAIVFCSSMYLSFNPKRTVRKPHSFTRTFTSDSHVCVLELKRCEFSKFVVKE